MRAWSSDTPVRVTRQWIGDAVLAAALVLVGILVTSKSGSWDMVFDRPIDAVGYALIAVAGLALAARRRWPVGTLAVVTVAISGYLVAGYPYGPIFFSFAVAVYSAARHLPLRTSAPAAFAALALLVPHLFTNSAALPGFLGLVPASAWVIVPFAIGVTVRVTREASRREKADALRQHLYDERLRVAQEVHDVVGHGLAAIKMQSDVALHLIRKKPEHAEKALETISRTSNDALEELRATLDLVRRDNADSSRAPTPGLARLEELLQRINDAGVHVELRVEGARRQIPAVADVVAYRVIQESLTNVLRHGGAKVANVRIVYHPVTVAVTVSNPPPHRPNAGSGLGISGMRQRVAALSGEFTAGTNDDGSFVVTAVIPTDGDV